jgi:hypothetical protein
MTRVVTVVAAALMLISLAEAQQSDQSVLASILSGHIPAASAHTDAPAKYRFTTEYTMLGPQGMETGTHVLDAAFVTDGKTVQWTTVTVGTSSGHGSMPTRVEHRAYLEGFKYALDAQKITSPEFFTSFPPDANDEKNLIWDELMFHSFASDLDRLRLNEPVMAQSGDVNLAGNGKFTNRRIELTLLGVGRRNGEDCLLVHYEALLNRFNIHSAGPVTVAGRSDYFGDIWVAIRSRQIEYGTLLEEVAGVVGNIPGAPGPQPLHVLRIATLARVH